ncbi:MAG: hypothetical protein ACR2H5_25870 [Ktedonobacteraceae bacterium]
MLPKNNSVPYIPMSLRQGAYGTYAKRFFSYHTDEYMQHITSQFFELVSFKRIQLADETRFRFQAMVLRKR